MFSLDHHFIQVYGSLVEDSVSRCSRDSFPRLSVKDGWEAARFSAGMTESLFDLKLCGVSPANPFPQEARIFPTTPFNLGEQRARIHEWILFHNRSVARAIMQMTVCFESVSIHIHYAGKQLILEMFRYTYTLMVRGGGKR
ncbi:hypothetical protein DYE48_19550 [Halobacillus trueperi]|uniref:Uncharacterized protein n=1 Tax=Halobacillus trueperi TaxID=156205 RepID=A0A3E0IZY6_9BACI|nr:hypothetical protein DYE48_19550 [Halobacillus trueperi]